MFKLGATIAEAFSKSLTSLPRQGNTFNEVIAIQAQDKDWEEALEVERIGLYLSTKLDTVAVNQWIFVGHEVTKWLTSQGYVFGTDFKIVDSLGGSYLVIEDEQLRLACKLKFGLCKA